MTSERLDVTLVQRGLARSRQHAVELIQAGAVTVGKTLAKKVSAKVSAETNITVEVPDTASYVGRGAVKLAGALDTFRYLDVTGQRCLDAGASTGGFTEVLLRRGAATVHAYDVGTGQLAASLQSDSRVISRERTNVRHLRAGDIDPAPTLVVADLSFISLTLVLPALVKVAAAEADFVLLVKPQFEVGHGKIGHAGVVREVAFRREAVETVLHAAAQLQLYPLAVTPSTLPGPTGNIEYFVGLRHIDYGQNHVTSVTGLDNMLTTVFSPKSSE